jgi:hypothetical protein
MLNCEGINWHHKISDTTDRVSHKPKSSQLGSTILSSLRCNGFNSNGFERGSPPRVYDIAKFKAALRKHLNTHSFYSADEFFMCKDDL